MISLISRWWKSRATPRNQAKLEAEMEEEMRFHLAMEEQYLTSHGTSLEQAKRRARISFGPEESFKEDIRQSMPLRWLSDLRTDVAYALKSLRHSPGFTTFAVIALGIGIGANATAFGFVDPVAFKKLSVRDPDRLVAIYSTQGSGTLGNIPYARFEELRRNIPAFEDAAGFIEHSVTVTAGKTSSLVYSVHTSDNYFSVLGVTAERGRVYRTGDTSRVVVGYRYWTNSLNSDSRIIGRSIFLDGVPFTIAGVAPENFHGTRLFTYEPAFWVPLEERRGQINMIARLTPDANVSEAQHALGPGYTVLSNAAPINPWLASRDRIELIGRLLLLGVCMVLFVACADVANLLLTRMTVRRQEIITRIALGVSASRLARQLLTESLVLVMLGAIASIPIAFIALRASTRLTPPLDFAPSFEPSLDTRVLLFTAGVSLVAAVVFGFAPLIQLWWRDLNPDRHNSLRAAGGSRSTVRSALVVVQVAVSVVAIAAAGLLYRGLDSARSIDLGFETKNSFVFTIDDRSGEISHSLKSALTALPGVSAVSFSSSIPLDGETRTLNAGGLTSDFFVADDDYFNTLGIPVPEGRTFSAHDTAGLEPVVINQTLARALFGSRSPIGRELLIGRSDGQPATVIGVSSSNASRRLGDKPRPILWRSTRRVFVPRYTIVVRSTRDDDDLEKAIRKQVSAINPAIPVVGFRSLEDRVALAYTAAKTGAFAGLIFGTLTTILAALGLFGVLLYNITQRTREIGIRRALGASSTDVLKMVTASSIRLTLIGTTIGMIAVLLIPQRMSAILYGVSPHDPALLIITPVAFLLVAILATIGPVWKAIRIEPIEALRVE